MLQAGLACLGEAQAEPPNPTIFQEEDQNEPNKYDDAFRMLRSEIYKHQGGHFKGCENTRKCLLNVKKRGIKTPGRSEF